MYIHRSKHTLKGKRNEQAYQTAKKGLARTGKKIRGSRVCIFGLSYKAGIPDTREAPSYALIEELVHEGADVSVYDPHVLSVEVLGMTFVSNESLQQALDDMDCAIFMVDHQEFKGIKWEQVDTKDDMVIVDTRNIFPDGVEGKVYVGLGK